MAYDPNNIWTGYLIDNPDVAYRGFLGNLGNRSNNFLDYFKNNYNNVYGDYMGKLGQQALSGQAPSMNFLDYLTGYNFNNAYNSLSPTNKGFRPSARVNWNIGF
jgi:hypothetical protein